MQGRRISQDEFILRAMEVHNNVYDYSKTIYTKMSKKIIYTCNRHGDIEQVAQDHVGGKGCKYCARNQPTENELLEKFKEYHPTLDFSKFRYTYQSNKSTFEVKCNICETTFYPCISNIINQKSGCPKCNNNLQKNTSVFISESTEIHGNKFDYNKVNYTNAHNVVELYCNVHDVEFSIPAYQHLNGRGCDKCSSETNSSHAVKMIENKLNFLGITYIREIRFDECRNVLPLPFDFFIEELNLCIEYDGAQHFKPLKHWGGEKSLKSRQENDEIKNKYCEDNNINLLRLKYNEPYMKILVEYINGRR